MSELYKHVSYVEDGIVRIIDGEPVVQLHTATFPWDVSGTLTEAQFKKSFGADGAFIKDMAANRYVVECNGWQFVPVQAHRATATDDTASVAFLVNNAVIDSSLLRTGDTWLLYLLTYEAETIFVKCVILNNRDVASGSGGGWYNLRYDGDKSI